jgi:hypothetical protein
MSTPYREILENAKTAIEQGFENLRVSIGPKHLVASFPCCMVSVGPATETPVSIGGRKERKVPVTVEVLVREYASRDEGYLQLADIVGHLEEMMREPNFLSGYHSRLTDTEFSGTPFYHENQFIHSASINLAVDLNF